MSQSRTSSGGRPRKYATSGERVRAYRSAHRLKKVTLEVPIDSGDVIKQVARYLRAAFLNLPGTLHPDERSSADLREWSGAWMSEQHRIEYMKYRAIYYSVDCSALDGIFHWRVGRHRDYYMGSSGSCRTRELAELLSSLAVIGEIQTEKMPNIWHRM